MKRSRGIRVRASGRFTSDRSFAVHMGFEGPLNIVKTLLRRGFPYKLRFEERQEDDWILTLNEEFQDSIMWSTSNLKEIMEIVGCIVERGGFDEEFLVNSGSRPYVRKGFRRIPEEGMGSFRKVLEMSVET